MRLNEFGILSIFLCQKTRDSELKLHKKKETYNSIHQKERERYGNGGFTGKAKGKFGD